MDDDAAVVTKEAAQDAALEWAASRIAALARGRVLDVGCGEGRFLPADSVGLDRDESRLRAARARSRHLVRADAHALPFRSATFDTALANRMLNDAGRIDVVLAEIARVLRAGGELLVLTLARREPSPLERLHDEARDALGLRRHRTRDDRLDDDNGAERLRRHFAAVRAERFERRHVLPDAGAALDHYARRYLFRRGRDASDAAALFERARPAIVRAAAAGEIVDVEGATLFVARKG